MNDVALPIDSVGARALSLVRTGPRGGPTNGPYTRPTSTRRGGTGNLSGSAAGTTPQRWTCRSRPTSERPADVAACVLTVLEAGPAHVVGISAGGMLARSLALARPELMRSLTLVATLCTFLRAGARGFGGNGRATARVQGMETLFPPAFGPRVRTRSTAPPRLCGRTTRPDTPPRGRPAPLSNFEARLPAVACPTLAVAGGEDVNAPVEAPTASDALSGNGIANQ